MANCIDCLHYKSCQMWATNCLNGYIRFPFQADTTGEEMCDYFKPTADVVPRDEVERGIVEYIEKHLRYKRKMVDIPFTSRDMRNYQCGAIDVIEYFEELVNELKEKYTKGGAKNE